jgi:hypothetical protein
VPLGAPEHVPFQKRGLIFGFDSSFNIIKCNLLVWVVVVVVVAVLVAVVVALTVGAVSVPAHFEIM